MLTPPKKEPMQKILELDVSETRYKRKKKKRSLEDIEKEVGE